MKRIFTHAAAVTGLAVVSYFIGCTDPPALNVLAPAGIIRGTVFYSGPQPCTENKHIIGTANMLLFDTRLLPPPDGLGVRSSRIMTVSGDVLFHDIASSVYHDPSGARYCPPAGVAPVSASAPFELGPVDPGKYQMRAFYDYNNDFHPLFKFANLPTLGDIAGGAIQNTTEVLLGGRVKYSTLTVGMESAAEVNSKADPEPGKRCSGTRSDGPPVCIPASGFVLQNVSITLGLPLPTQRPYFSVSSVDFAKDKDGNRPAQEVSPSLISVPADFHVADAAPFTVQDSLPVLTLRSGVRDEERAAAMAAPFYAGVDNPGVLLTMSNDSNRDGVISSADTIIGSTLARSMWPLISLSKLDMSDPYRRTVQDKPRVIASAITAYSADASEPGKLTNLIARTVLSPEARPFLTAVLRPTAICIPDAADANGPTTVVTPYEVDSTASQAKIISEYDKTLDDVATQLGRKRDGVRIVYACLPPANLSLNLIYPLTGQAWTLPNEMATCIGSEVASADGLRCGQRARLSSQGTLVQFAPATNSNYCRERVTALKDQGDGEGSPYANVAQRYRETCLTEAEKTKFDQGTLWDR